MKHLLHYIVTLLLLFAVYPSRAQTVVDGWIIENIHGPSQLGIVDTIPVDINHDGLMDVVSASIDDGHLRAYINQGNSVFEQQYISTDVYGAYRVSATDFNNDGEIDFLLPSIETDQIIALIADPSVNPYGYRKQIIAEGVLLPTDAQAGDFNNDGLMDVVSLSFEGNLVLFHLQDELGQFGNQRLAEMVLKPRKLVVADFNNDGMVDVLVASSEDNSIRFFENQGLANFTEHLISDQMTGARYLAPCDFNSDELIDLVVSATADNTIYMFTNLGEGFEIKAIDQDTPGANTLHCANIDSDAEMELVAVASVVDSIFSYELTGELNKHLIANRRDGYLSVNTIDVNNSGNTQILSQAYFENRNLTYTPSATNLEQIIWEDFPDGAYDVEAGDIDGDGDKDLVYVAFREDKVYWVEKTTNGYQTHLIFDGVDGPQSIKLADIDQDGDLDAFTAGAWDDSFWFHQNQGAGTFMTFLITDSANNAARLDVMDVDGDQQLDVIGTSSLDDSLRWFNRTGVQFTEILIDNQLDGALALRVDDLNLDGYDDILVGSFFGNSISSFINNGFGNFSHQLLSVDKLKPTSILSADIDNDLDVDIVFNASQDNKVWLLNNNAGVFEEVLVHDRLTTVYSLVFTDFESAGGKGVIDVSDQEGVVYINKNNDNTVFTPKVLFQVLYGIRKIINLSGNEAELPQFALASNRGNSIQLVTRSDMIFKSGFDYNIAQKN